MFTLLAFALIAFLAWYGKRGNETDRPMYERDRDDIWLLALHLRQDLKIVAFFLGSVIIMLGIIADRIH